MAEQAVYKVRFVSGTEQYEVYVKELITSSVFGFIEIADFVWDNHTDLVVDPSHERLKDEFADVERTYVPMHNVLRIDHVKKQGTAKITALSEGASGDNVRSINSPIYTPKK